MSKGAKRPSLYDLGRQPLDSPEDFEEYWQEIRAGSDRGACLISCAALDHILIRLIRTKLIDLTDPEGDKLFFERGATLGSLSERTDIAYAIGVINASQQQDLNSIRRIRNGFAHSAKNVSFNTQVVANECDKLQNYKNPNPDGKIISTPRDKYMETLHTLYLAFQRSIIVWQNKTLRQQKRILRKLRAER